MKRTNSMSPLFGLRLSDAKRSERSPERTEQLKSIPTETHQQTTIQRGSNTNITGITTKLKAVKIASRTFRNRTLRTIPTLGGFSTLRKTLISP